MMHPDDVLEALDTLASAGIRCWLDGGWGIDALVGEQTRPHDDLDLVIVSADIERAITALGERRFVMHFDQRPTSFVLRDPADRRVDFHPIYLDEHGGGIQVQPDGSGFCYSPEGLLGSGRVAGRSVRCLSAEFQVICHVGYEPDEGDFHDMRLLCDRLGIALVPPYDEPLPSP